MKYFFLSLFFVFSISCQPNSKVDSDLNISFKSVSVVTQFASDFSAQSYKNGIRLSWTLNNSNDQILLKRSVNIGGAKKTLYRGVNDFFEDVNADFNGTDSYTYHLYQILNSDEYEYIAELTISFDDQENVNLFPATNLRYLIKQGEVYLSWDEPNDVEVEGYEIIKNDSESYYVEKSFWVDQQPNLDEENSYEVFSVNSSGVRSSSSLKITENVPLPIFQNIEMSQVVSENNQVLLSWVVPQSDLYLKTVIYKNNEMVFDDIEKTGSFIDNQVVNGGAYTYAVEHVNTSNVSSDLLVLDLTVTDTIAAQNISSFIVDARNNQANINWSNPGDIDFDYVELYRDSVLIYSGNDESFIDSNVLNESSISYQIRTLDQSGNASGIDQLAVTVIDDIPPQAITAAKIEIYDAQLNINWEAPIDDAVNIEIFRSDVQIDNYGDGEFLHSQLVSSSTSYKDLELSNESTYYYGLYAVDASNNISAVYQLNATPELEGRLDLGFNGTGFSEFGSFDMMMRDVRDSQIDSQGRLVVIWNDYNIQPSGGVIERRMQNGDLDMSFGVNGLLVLSDAQSYYPSKLLLDENDDIFVSGYFYETEDQIPFLAKYSVDGLPINSFGVDVTIGDLSLVSDVNSNILTVNNSLFQLYNASELNYDGQYIYMIGEGYNTGSLIYTMRVDSTSGELDAGYANNAGVSLVIANHYNFKSALTNSGGLQVLGTNGSNNGVFRLTSNGDLDPSFNAGSLFQITVDANCIQVLDIDELLIDDSDNTYLIVRCYDNIAYTYQLQIHKLDIDGDYYIGYGDEGLGVLNFEVDSNGGYARSLIDEQQNIWIATTVGAEVGNNIKLTKYSNQGVLADDLPVEYVDIMGVGLYKNLLGLMYDPSSKKPVIFGSKYENNADELFMIRPVIKSPDYVAPLMN